jgi:phosphoglycolate phosphatase
MIELAPRRFRFLVFDWDGACADVGEPVPCDADARFVIGLGLSDALRHVAPGLPQERWQALTDRYRHHYLSRDGAIPLFDGARELLDELDAAGFLLGLATGKSRVGLARALEQQQLVGRFVATRCADEGFPKPHPDMLLHLMDRVGAQASETLMIGDTTHDLELAKNAGASALAVAYGAHEIEGLARLEPLATVHSIGELRQWLIANA